MTSIQIDRRAGLSSSTAIKGPCKAATTANITLSGEQTIDGVACVALDRVLVKDQTSVLENGIYIVSTGVWARSKDFASNRDVRKGSRVRVTDGTSNGGTDWAVSANDPITIGTTSITWQVVAGENLPTTASRYIRRNDAGAAYEALTEQQSANLDEIKDVSPGATGLLLLADETAADARSDMGLETTSTDNAIVKFDGVTGQTQNTGVTIDDNNALSLPVSASGSVSIFLGSQPSGTTGIYIYTGSENIVGMMTQGNDSAHFSNGSCSAGAFNSFGDVTIADDAYLEIDHTGALIDGYQGDRQGMLAISGNGVATAGLIQYRVAAGTNGEINIIAQSLTNIEVNTTADDPPTVTNYTDGKFTVLTNKTADKMFFVNRRGASIVFSWMWIGSGAGMNKGALFQA